MINLATAEAVVLGRMLGPLLAHNAPLPKAVVARMQMAHGNPVTVAVNDLKIDEASAC